MRSFRRAPWRFLLTCMWAWLMVGASASGQSSPPQWISIYGDVMTEANQAVPAGTLVEALTPSGKVCGTFVVVSPGKYGLLACAIAGPDSPNGVVGGDRVLFQIGGRPAKPALTLPLTIAMGDLFQHNLVLTAPVAPVAIPEPFTLALFGTGLVGFAAYIGRRRVAGREK
jgi:hypothetical protein